MLVLADAGWAIGEILDDVADPLDQAVQGLFAGHREASRTVAVRAISLAVNGRLNRRFRPSFTAGLKAAGAVTWVHSLIDPAAIRRFRDLGIGVYSDEPFPPLDEAAPNARMPSFSGQDATPPCLAPVNGNAARRGRRSSRPPL